MFLRTCAIVFALCAFSVAHAEGQFKVHDHFLTNPPLLTPASPDTVSVHLSTMPGTVSIVKIDADFYKNFHPKVERPVEEKPLHLWDVKSAANSESTYFFLIKDKEITLGQLYALLQAQPQGQQGPLITGQNQKNVAYARDINGETRVVFVIWDGEKKGWAIGSVYLSGLALFVGDRVISR
jgi:hypothetical protein